MGDGRQRARPGSGHGRRGLRAEVSDRLAEQPAADTTRARWTQKSVTSAELAREYGFADVDGSQPDVWRYNEAAGDRRDPRPQESR